MALSTILCVAFFLRAAAGSWSRPRARPAARAFGDVPFLSVQGPAWPSSPERSRRLRSWTATNGTTAAELPQWEAGHRSGVLAGPDGGSVRFEASARPHRRWSEILSADLEKGVGSVDCLGSGRHVTVVVEGSGAVISRWASAVRDASRVAGHVLLIGSGAWACNGDSAWYVSVRRVLDEEGGVLELMGAHLELHEAFEELDFRLAISPPSQGDSANATGRRMADSDKVFADSLGASTSYGFNWDFANDRPENEVLSLIDVGASVGSSTGDISVSAGLQVQCIACFVRAVAGIDVRYSFSLFRGQPRVYVGLGGNAELHGWVEIVSTVAAESTWDRMLYYRELEKIDFFVYGFPVSLTPVLSLRSTVSITGGRLVGSVRGGLGARGHVNGRIELNTDGWDALPSDRRGRGVKGLQTGIDVEVAQRVVTPTFAFDAGDLNAVVKIIPAFAVKFFDAFSLEMAAEGAIGVEIADQERGFNFASSPGDLSGMSYAKPDIITNLRYDIVRDWGEFRVKFKMFGEEVEYVPSAPLNVDDATDAGGGLRTFDFRTAELKPSGHVRFMTSSRRNTLETLVLEAEVTNKSGQGVVLRGMAKCLETCEPVPRQDGEMLQCSCQIQLDTTDVLAVARLAATVFWVPNDMIFVPPINTLFFTLPLHAADGDSLPVWGAGGRYQVSFVLNPMEVLQGTVRLTATQKSNGARLELLPNQTYIDVRASRSTWDFIQVLVPTDVRGELEINASWKDLSSQARRETVSVDVKPRNEVGFDIVSLDPASATSVSAFEDLEVQWRVEEGMDGVVFVTTLDGISYEVVQKRVERDASGGKIVFPWLSFRGVTALSRQIVIVAEFRCRSRCKKPISVVRMVSVTSPPRPASRRLGGLGRYASSNATTTPLRRTRRLPRRLSTLSDLRDAMFGGCKKNKKYAIFSSFSVGVALRIDGVCRTGVVCPEGNVAAGFVPVFPAAALNCSAYGENWCQGGIYSCSHAMVEPEYQPVIALKLARQMDTTPFESQLDFFRQRIATALSVLPPDVELPDIARLAAESPELVFKLARATNFQLSEELVSAAVDAGLLSFEDADLVQPLSAVAAGSAGGRRLLGADAGCPSEKVPSLLVELGSPAGFSGRGGEAVQIRPPSGGRRLAGSLEGLAIVGVEERSPGTYDPPSVLWSVTLTNIMTAWALVAAFVVVLIGLEVCRRAAFRSRLCRKTTSDTLAGSEMTFVGWQRHDPTSALPPVLSASRADPQRQLGDLRAWLEHHRQIGDLVERWAQVSAETRGQVRVFLAEVPKRLPNLEESAAEASEWLPSEGKLARGLAVFRSTLRGQWQGIRF